MSAIALSSRLLRAIAVVLLLYSLAYLAARTSWVERWAADDREYVIFPAATPVLYYFFRPASYLDGWLTGMRCHIGPHR